MCEEEVAATFGQHLLCLRMIIGPTGGNEKWIFFKSLHFYAAHAAPAAHWPPLAKAPSTPPPSPAATLSSQSLNALKISVGQLATPTRQLPRLLFLERPPSAPSAWGAPKRTEKCRRCLRLAVGAVTLAQNHLPAPQSRRRAAPAPQQVGRAGPPPRRPPPAALTNELIIQS